MSEYALKDSNILKNGEVIASYDPVKNKVLFAKRPGPQVYKPIKSMLEGLGHPGGPLPGVPTSSRPRALPARRRFIGGKR